jgi:hypothetical protein
MTFLNPAILFGLIAAAIPIILHFLNLRKLNKIEFSTLSFLKELQKTKIKRIKIKQWLLLLLRIAIILLLVAAFARPTVKKFTFGNSSVAKTTAVIIVDNTFSMSVVTEKGSYLNQAKQLAKSLLNNFQEGDEIVVIPLGNFKHDIKPTSNFAVIKKEIDDIPVSLISRTLNDAVVASAQILSESKNFNKEIFILTDLQKGRIYNSESELSNLTGSLNKNVRMFVINFHEKDASNLGINDLVPNNQIFEKGKMISFSAKIKNYSNRPVTGSVASLFIKGKRSAQQSLNLIANEIKEVTFETNLSDTGLVDITCELEDDDIIQDNKRYSAIYVPGNISVLLLSDKTSNTKFIKLALQGHSKNKFNIDEKSLSRISNINLTNYNAVIVVGSEENNDWNNIKNYIIHGGSAVIFPGNQTSVEKFQNLCSSIGISAPITAMGEINSTKTVFQFGKIDYNNIFFSDLFENSKQVQIESPEIYRYFKILPGTNGKIIIPMYDNSGFLSEIKLGSGKVILFNSAPELSSNNFPLKGIFAPLINKSLMLGISKTKDQERYFTGQEITADISNHQLQLIKIESPDGLNEMINIDSLVNKNYLVYSGTAKPGIYKFFSGDKLLDYIPVNHDPRESVTESSDNSDLRNYLDKIMYRGSLTSLSPADDISKTIYQSRYGTELWKYCLILVLILALAESFIARSAKEEEKTLQK